MFTVDNNSSPNTLNSDFFFNRLWADIFSDSFNELLNSLMLDNYLKISLDASYFTSNFIRSFIFSKENNLMFFYHPELI